MTIVARLELGQATDRRSSRRRKLYLDSSLSSSGDAVTIHDLSETGMLIETTAELAPFDNLQVELPEVGTTRAIIVWTSGRYYGCQFNERVTQASVSAALLRSPPANAVPSAPTLAKSETTSPSDIHAVDDAEAELYEEKASLSVRLRMILGSTIILWALIIWAVYALTKLIRWAFSVQATA